MIPHVNEPRNEFNNVELEYTKETTRHIKWHHKIFLNRSLRVGISLLLVAILTPVILYQYVYFAGYDLVSPDGYSLGSCLVPRSSRLLCGTGNVTVEECHHQCCYDHNNNICFHRFPSRFSYIMNEAWDEHVVLKPRVATVPYKLQNSLTNIRLSLDEKSPTHLTVTFYNSAQYNITGQRIENKKFDYTIESPELNILVNATQGSIFNTLRGPIIASENIWEVAIKLTEESMYGFGEIPIKAHTVKVIYDHKGGLSSIPLVYAKINESYHGLLIDTVDPTEVSFREENVIVIRSITNFGLKFHLFVGPKPADVMRDVMEHVGFNNDLEYWMLGAHVCSDFSSIDEITAFIREANSQNMPYESHCVKPIVFDNLCKTDPITLVNDGARLLRNAGKKFIPHVSPHIMYESIETNTTNENETDIENAIEPDVELTSNCSFKVENYTDYMLQLPDSTGMYKGKVGCTQVVYPDYESLPDEHIELLWMYTTDIDGVILENTWPLDESDKMVNETNLFLPYFSATFEEAFNLVPQWNATKVNGEKYLYNHNEYGTHFSKAIERVTNTSNIWMGSSNQKMNGNVHMNRQNITTSWTNLQKELIETALGGISGHWLWSTPICGDTDNFDSETHLNLCVKWYLAATYFPMIKIHSKETARDPLSFAGTDRTLMINALRSRLMLAPYFYTTLQEGPLLRPMFYQFPESDYLKDLTGQFSVGSNLLIAPNLHPSQAMVHVIMPPGVWYEMWSGFKIDAEEGQAVTMATVEADFLTLIQGGSIIVMQKDVGLTADLTRSQSSFSLIIALVCETALDTREIEENTSTVSSVQLTCVAFGSLYMSPNATLHFEADGKRLHITVDGDSDIFCVNTMSRYITDISIYGLEDELNNYDHMRNVNSVIDLCELGTATEILFDFISAS